MAMFGDRSLSQNIQRVFRGVRFLIWKTSLWGDYFRLKRQVGHFIRTEKRPAGGQKVLFISLNDSPSQFKMEMFWAKALQLEGAEPVILTSPAQKVSPRYFTLFGVHRFVRLEDYAQSSDASDANARLNVDPASPLDFAKVKGIEVEGVRLGQHILSTFIAERQNSHAPAGTPNFDRYVADAYSKGVRMIKLIRRLFDDVRPDAVIFLEKGYLPYALFFDLAIQRGLNVIQWCSASETDAYVLKRYSAKNQSHHPISLSADTWQKLRDVPWDEKYEHEIMALLKRRYTDDVFFNRNKLRTKARFYSAGELRALLDLDPKKKTAVVFSHILWDATFFYGTNLFEDFEKWLMETIQAAVRNPQLNWVIKLHPDYLWKLKGGSGSLQEPALIRESFGELPGHVKILLPDAPVNTLSLFEITDYCVTVRGTIGIEMACFGIPVITAGTGRYAELGFTSDPRTTREYFEILGRLQDFPPLSREQVTMARKFAYALFKWRPFRVQNVRSAYRPVSQVRHPLFLNYSYTFKNRSELETAEDMRSFATWVLNSKEEDYLSGTAGQQVQERIQSTGAPL